MENVFNLNPAHTDDVLYFFNEPMLWVFRLGKTIYLCKKADELEDVDLIHVVEATDDTINLIKTNQLTLRDAFLKIPSWSVPVNTNFDVVAFERFETVDAIPDLYLAKEGIFLFPTKKQEINHVVSDLSTLQ